MIINEIIKLHRYVNDRIDKLNNDIVILNNIKTKLANEPFEYDTLQNLQRVEYEIFKRQQVLKRYYNELYEIENNEFCKNAIQQATSIINGGAL